MATKLNLIFERGTTWSQQILLTDDNGDPLVFSGHTANVVMRKSWSSNVALTFDCTLTTGSLLIEKDANTTANVVAGRYVWDALISKDGNVDKIATGLVTVNPTASV